jgi:hypothetical protein
MKAGHNKILAKAAVCLLLVTAATEPAVANSIPTTSDVVWIGVGIGAIGAGIGIGVYYAVHHNHSLNGCAVSGANGLELQNKGDQQTYALVGAVNAIKPGERIRVSGKRVKKSSGPTPQFLVESLSKDFGPCPAKPTMQ